MFHYSCSYKKIPDTPSATFLKIILQPFFALFYVYTVLTTGADPEGLNRHMYK